MRRHTSLSGERGSITPALLVLLVCVSVALVGVARVGGAAHRRARVDAAADLTALAAATSTPEVAEQVAQGNGVQLLGVETRADGAVQVHVERGAVQSAAAARAVPAGGRAREPVPARR